MLPYQKAWLADRSRFRIALKARQIRWSTTVAFEAFVNATFRMRRQLIVSSSEKQAQEVLEKVKAWGKIAMASGLPIHYQTENTTELCVTGGKPIISLAQNPATIEGYSGDVILDEFSKHSRDRDIYRAVFPSITAGYRISVVGVPLGESGQFYDLWSKFPAYSKHRVTIHDAIAAGLDIPGGVESLQQGLDDESFRQQYLCEFIDESTAYLPYNLFLPCVGARPDGLTGSIYLGVDVGRRKDITVVYVVQQLGDEFFTRRIECLKGQQFEVQRRVIRQVWQEERATRGAIDATGIGAQLAEELQKTLNVEPVTFTNDWKEQAAVSVKRLFENRALQIPDDRELHADIHSIKRTVTSAGNIRFDADRTDAGHADRFWAMALAVHAAQKPRPSVKVY